ncbi:hypothetical protein SBA4_5010002 [Candidatus Sulfopaludibacter sp. SbA4]|nr:hypothetical protein SBA4_5010002 [Candidatus Sulfopaludibacter sp. SbA4]
MLQMSRLASISTANKLITSAAIGGEPGLSLTGISYSGPLAYPVLKRVNEAASNAKRSCRSRNISLSNCLEGPWRNHLLYPKWANGCIPQVRSDAKQAHMPGAHATRPRGPFRSLVFGFYLR